MNDRDARGPESDPDGVRVFARRPGRRTVRPRSVLRGLAFAATGVAVLSAAAVLFLRGTLEPRALRETPLREREERRVATQPLPPPGSPRRRALPRDPGARGARPVPIAKVADRGSPRDTVPDGGVPTAPAADGGGDRAQVPAVTDRAHRALEDMVEDFVDRSRASGETEGLAAFPPKGTNPPRTGVVVPATFALPEGYVRYYQVTDDGQRLEPILMYSPDFEFVDDQGQPIALPEDRVVPPDMVPAGLPVRMLDVPQDRRAARRGAKGEGR
jgi:hypothetical protein